MELFGREYGLLLSVGAEQEIARLCPEEDLRRLREVLIGTDSAAFERTKELLCILSRWHEKARAFREPGYEPQPLTQELLDLATPAQFLALQAEAMRRFTEDRKQTVEAEASKKNGAPKSS